MTDVRRIDLRIRSDGVAILRLDRTRRRSTYRGTPAELRRAARALAVSNGLVQTAADRWEVGPGRAPSSIGRELDAPRSLGLD